MDMVVREHLTELAAATDIRVTALVIAPGVDASPQAGTADVAGLAVQVFVGDLRTETSATARACRKLWFVISRRVPLLTYGFKSTRMADAIADELRARRFDVIVVEHINVMANLSIASLVRSGSKVVYISHDSLVAYVSDLAKTKTGLVAKFFYRFETLRARLIEQGLFRIADRVIHLSEYECRLAAKGGDKHVSLLPPLFARQAGAPCGVNGDRRLSRDVLFVGAPSHFPNRMAILWIRDRLAPVLWDMDKTIKIVLVGSGTEQFNGPDCPNILGMGLVSDEAIRHLFQTCICSISPISLAGGIKVKVLHALAMGCPVVATRHSLNGFEAFSFDDVIDLSDPESAARMILSLAPDEANAAARAATSRKWNDFLQRRRGALAAILNGVATTSAHP
jgi:glycosyltransferase involved in cell wall biosynthesis